MIAEVATLYRKFIRESLVPRDELLLALTDRALTFQPGGDCPALGELCRGIGETQHSYAESFRTFRVDFDYRFHDPSIAFNVERLRRWYGDLDDALEAALAGLSEADAGRTVYREGEHVALAEHLLTFNEALLLFFGKAFVYLKAGRMAMPNKWGAWVA